MADDATARHEAEGLYTIGVVTRLTGLSADTIRKWEERHAAVTPSRTAGNTRRFSAADVRRLRLLGALTAQGHHIRDVAERLALGEEASFSRLREDYLAAVRDFDARRAGRLLTRAGTLLGPRDFAYQVVLPILRATGDLWSHGEFSVAQEHLVSAQLRGLLTTMLHWSASQPGARRIALTTPEGHWHEFGVLVGALLAVSQGFDPVYLGPSLPAGDIGTAVERSGAELVVLSVVRDLDDAELESVAATLRELAAAGPVWMGLPAGHRLRGVDTGARYLDHFEELDLALAQAGASGTFTHSAN